jgi:hypothetical protein
MDFNIRAISLAESVKADARVVVGDCLGKEVSFRTGVNILITLPDSKGDYGVLPEPERLLTALAGWTRVYRYPEGEHDSIHILATADCNEGEIVFYRIDIRQPPPRSRRAPRSAVEISGGAVMTYEQCASWLIELSFRLSGAPGLAPRRIVLSRPRPIGPKPIRVAWIGPEILEGVDMVTRLQAIGRVYGAHILQIAPRSYSAATARLRQALPLDAAIICSRFAPFIGTEAIPNTVRQDLVHICSSKTRADLECQVRTWTELAIQQIEEEHHQASADEGPALLIVMLRGMLSHSKIGQFNHCQKATVLTGVRARHLNVALAEGILDRNSEIFQDTKSSDAFFLWKEHHDGRQYFLNPQKVEAVKAFVEAVARQ